MQNKNMFKFHKLNEAGQEKSKSIQAVFETTVSALETCCAESSQVGGREFAIAKTKLEEACFFAKKSMAMQPENQDLT